MKTKPYPMATFWSGLLLLALWLGGGGAARAAVDFSLQLGDVTWTGGGGSYACFSSTAYPNTVNFTISKSGTGRTAYAVTAGPSGNTGTYTRKLRSGSYDLNYQLFTTSAMNYQWKAPTTATANEVLSGQSANKAQTIPLSFVFYVPPGQVVPPGTYTDTVSVRIYPAYNSTGSPYDSRTITLKVTVAADAAISIVPTGGAFNSSSPNLTLDFGTLSAGQTKNCDVLVKQNNNCTVYFSSDNSGYLKRVPATSGDQIPYTAIAAGAAVNLAQTGQAALPAGIPASPDGNRYPITVTIGNFDGVTAGTYQDRITLTVVAQ
ncbi:MAG TPA: spore coat protein U domain-containing protein [Dongiaceae bacterium]|nr:spore coat protein U domain-containing protein [Dongiaceae bacterium]